MPEPRIRIRKITVIVLVIFFLSIVANYKFIAFVFTGLSYGIISLSVAEHPEGVITTLTHPPSVVVNNPMDFSVSFKNIGNVNITETIVISINSSSTQNIATLRDDSFNLGMGQTRTFATKYTPTSTGSLLAHVVVSYAGKKSEANATFFVSDTPSVTSPSLGGGGGGGGGFFGGPKISETSTISEIFPEQFKIFEIEQGDILKIQGIEIESRSYASNVQIIVKEASLPFAVSAPIAPETGSTYQYLEISKSNIKDEDIKNAKVKFKVERSWINENSIDEDTVSMNRLEQNWKKLPTIKLGEDESNVYYEAETPGFSVFAITGEKRLLTAEYPEYLKLNRGQSSLIQIFVRNDGDVDANNLVLFSSDSVLSLEINPTSLSVLNPESSFVFLITVKAPREAPVGTYPIDLTLASDRVTKKIRIEIELEVQELEVEVEQSIKTYENSIGKLVVEIEKALREGRNPSAAIENLNKSKSELQAAKQLYASQDYAGAKIKLEEVRTLLEDTTVQLAKTVGPKIIFVPISIPNPEILGMAAGTVGLSAYGYYRKRKEDESYRKSIRKAIQKVKGEED